MMILALYCLIDFENILLDIFELEMKKMSVNIDGQSVHTHFN